MEIKERIIVALDVDDVEKAKLLVEKLAPYVGCFKIGLEFINSIFHQLISSNGMKAMDKLTVIRQLFKELNGRIFWDGKFNDIPNTVTGASQAVIRLGVKIFDVHCFGGSAMMKAAKEAVNKMIANGEIVAGNSPIILGVTLLTSLNYQDLVEMGIYEELNIAGLKELARIERARIERLAVQHLAWLAQECGLNGVVASPHEIEAIRDYCQPEFLIVTPGVRPKWAEAADQKRVMTPAEAIKAGADYLVIGRPILQPPAEIGSPVEAVKRITEEIASAR